MDRSSCRAICWQMIVTKGACRCLWSAARPPRLALTQTSVMKMDSIIACHRRCGARKLYSLRGHDFISRGKWRAVGDPAGIQWWQELGRGWQWTFSSDWAAWGCGDEWLTAPFAGSNRTLSRNFISRCLTAASLSCRRHRRVLAECSLLWENVHRARILLFQSVIEQQAVQRTWCGHVGGFRCLQNRCTTWKFVEISCTTHYRNLQVNLTMRYIYLRFYAWKQLAYCFQRVLAIA